MRSSGPVRGESRGRCTQALYAKVKGPSSCDTVYLFGCLSQSGESALSHVFVGFSKLAWYKGSVLSPHQLSATELVCIQACSVS